MCQCEEQMMVQTGVCNTASQLGVHVNQVEPHKNDHPAALRVTVRLRILVYASFDRTPIRENEMNLSCAYHPIISSKKK